MQSDYFYNAGWTEDLRRIIPNVQKKYPKSPLIAVGTSIGANILVCIRIYLFFSLLELALNAHEELQYGQI